MSHLNTNTKPVIAVYTSSATDEKAPDFGDEHHRLAYQQIFTNLIKLGAKPIVVYGAETHYAGNAKFNSYYLPELKNHEIVFHKVDEDIKSDFLYDRARFPYQGLYRLNDNRMIQVCRDKYLSYLFAPDMHARSFLITDKKQLDTFWLSHPTERVVLKQIDSYGGAAVFVGVEAEYKNTLMFPLIAQEFVDTSGGYKNLTSGYHDVRVALYDGDPIYGLLREPPQDGFISNLMFGGTIRALGISEIPPEVIDKAKILDKRFHEPTPRFFSADFGFDGSDWKLFEMNDSTGVVHSSVVGPAADDFLWLLSKKLYESAIA
jgi:glutathione synthase/RimK-type ligase-like ATP-grasp enzyme